MKMKACTLLLLLTSIIVSTLTAQNGSRQNSGDLLHRAARLDVHDVSLESALRELWRRSSVPLAFSPDLMKGLLQNPAGLGPNDTGGALKSLIFNRGAPAADVGQTLCHQRAVSRLCEQCRRPCDR